MFLWTPWALPGIVSGALSLALAALVWRTARDAAVRRRMAILLVSEGMGQLTGLFGPPFLIADADLFAAAWTLHLLNDCVLLAVYLPAVASVVSSPLLRTFERGPGRAVLTALAVLYALAVLAAPTPWVSTIGENFPGYGSPHTPRIGPIAALIFASLFCSYILGFVATAIQWRRATPGVSRRRAGALTLAFGARDFTVGGMYLTGAASVALGIELMDPSMERIAIGSVAMGYVGASAYVLLTSYAIAVYNVIEIDLRIKTGLKQSTVAAAFVALFFVVSEGSAALLSDTFGTLAAIAATGVLLFFISPLQELASRVSDRAMPEVQDTPEYRHFRKLQIYGEAVRHASAGGEIDAVQRVALDRLRDELALSADEATSFEDDLGLVQVR